MAFNGPGPPPNAPAGPWPTPGGSIRNTLGSGLKARGVFQKDGRIQNLRGGFVGPKQQLPGLPGMYIPSVAQETTTFADQYESTEEYWEPEQENLGAGMGNQSMGNYQGGNTNQGGNFNQPGIGSRGMSYGQGGSHGPAGGYGPAAGYGQNVGYGQGAPAGGYGQGAPAGGYGQGAPAGGYGQGAPVGGYGQGAPAGGYGQGAPVGGYGQGAPIGGYGQGAPAGGYGQGMPAGGYTQGGYGQGVAAGMSPNLPRQLILQAAQQGIVGNGVATISPDHNFTLVANLPPPQSFNNGQNAVYATYLVDKKGTSGFLAGVLRSVGNGVYQAQFRSSVPLTHYERAIVSVENPQNLAQAPKGFIVLKVKEPMGAAAFLSPAKNAGSSIWQKVTGLFQKKPKAAPLEEGQVSAEFMQSLNQAGVAVPGPERKE